VAVVTASCRFDTGRSRPRPIPRSVRTFTSAHAMNGSRGGCKIACTMFALATGLSTATADQRVALVTATRPILSLTPLQKPAKDADAIASLAQRRFPIR